LGDERGNNQRDGRVRAGQNSQGAIEEVGIKKKSQSEPMAVTTAIGSESIKGKIGNVTAKGRMTLTGE